MRPKLPRYDIKVIDMDQAESFDVVVIGGGPAGATAAEQLAQSGYS
ncbi:MAG: Pyridine nucleotide-disulfide oxidoreductase, partial [Pseudomonadota bacterium]